MNDYFVTMQHQFHNERIRKGIAHRDGSRARAARIRLFMSDPFSR